MVLAALGGSSAAHGEDAGAAAPRRSRAVASLSALCAKRGQNVPEAPGTRGLKIVLEGGSPEERAEAVNVLSRRVGERFEKVTLPSLVGKHAGETEKNLARLLEHAERTDVVLFLDEADALLGKRAETKDGADGASAEEARLVLERLRAHEGLVFLGHTSRLDDKARASLARRLHAFVRASARGEELWRAACGGSTPPAQ